jgi:hypothetical protein
VKQSVSEIPYAREGATGNVNERERRKLRNEEINKLYSSPNIIRMIKLNRMRWIGYVTHIGAKRKAYRFLAGKSEGKRQLGKPKHRW